MSATAKRTVPLVVAVVGTATLWMLSGLVPGCERRAPNGTPSGNVLPNRQAPAVFSDVTDASGLAFVHDSGAVGQFYYPEIMGSGAAWLDIDADDDLDVYLVQGRPWTDRPDEVRLNRLFRNDHGTFVDVTDASGAGDTGYGMGCCAGDVNNDGLADLYVTNLGENRLYLNEGAGRFSDVTATAGVGDARWGMSCAFLDYDRDGYLDLFVTNYIHWSPDHELECRRGDGARDYCNPNAYSAPAPDILYRNRGDGTFADVTEQTGIAYAFGNGLGVLCADFDGDGWIDIYVANDQNPNIMWINRQDGTFQDRSLISGTSLNGSGKAESSMGLDAQDVDEDGDLDILATHFWGESHTYYENLGRGEFIDRTAHTGIQRWSTNPTGFGVAFFDYDHDGRLDLFVANGRVERRSFNTSSGQSPYGERNSLARGENGRFVDVTDEAGPALLATDVSRGAAVGDYDNDGDLDILVANNRGGVQLLRNDGPKVGHWLMVRATTGTPPRDAIGAVVRLRLESGRNIRRDVRLAASYCSSNDHRTHFTFPREDRPNQILVEWVDGSRETFDPAPPDSFLHLHQGTGRSVGRMSSLNRRATHSVSRRCCRADCHNHEHGSQSRRTLEVAVGQRMVRSEIVAGGVGRDVGSTHAGQKGG